MEVWIGLWQKYFSTNVKEAFKSLVYLGYCGLLNQATSLKKFKIKDLLKISNRKIFNCYVVGAHGCGKSSFLDSFIGVEHEHPMSTTTARSVVNLAYDNSGTSRYLIVKLDSC